MDVQLIDPRDSVWEIHDPVFRISFHGPGSEATYELRGAELDEVRAWADANGARHWGDWCAIYVVVPEKDGRVGLVHVAGDPPARDPLRGD